MSIYKYDESILYHQPVVNLGIFVSLYTKFMYIFPVPTVYHTLYISFSKVHRCYMYFLWDLTSFFTSFLGVKIWVALCSNLYIHVIQNSILFWSTQFCIKFSTLVYFLLNSFLKLNKYFPNHHHCKAMASSMQHLESFGSISWIINTKN